jgi:hypothetical protein
MIISLVDEVAGANFGDKRLNQRFRKLVEALGDEPNLSIPAATKGRAEMEAAYRFCDNEKVTLGKVLEPHFQATIERMAQQDFVVLAQDTTEIVLTRPNQQVVGAGPMDCESRRGAFLHPLHAFTLDGLPLGMVWQKSWTRAEIEIELTRQQKSANRRQAPIEEKESVRWLEGLRAARAVATACPDTTCVCVGDSESDVYELFCEPRATSRGEVHLLVRACHPRSTADQSSLLDKVQGTPCLYECTVDVSARTPKIAKNQEKGKREKARAARIATAQVRATQVTLKPPYRPDRKLPEVSVNIVLVKEAEPPTGCDPIEWQLITTLPIDNAEQVMRIVHSYCARWQIEIFFRTLKSGCRVESRQFETLARLQNCLGLYCIVAWRIMYLCRLGRACPDLNCEIVFEPCEWKAVYVVVKGKQPPKEPPRLNEVVRMVASLGGYVIRPKTQPGPQTLWIGLQRLHDLSTAWKAFGPQSEILFSQETCVVR